MKFISLTQGKFSLVDDEDYDWLTQRKWFAMQLKYSKDRPFIALSWDGKGKHVLMHRVIVDAQEGMVVDHINHVMLDNRRCNLRVCTHSQNSMNKCRQSNNTSGFTGVTWHHGVWEARIMVSRKSIYLGSAHSPEEASLLYKQGVVKYFGQFAYQEDLRGSDLSWTTNWPVTD
jgi:hypothetical protein